MADPPYPFCHLRPYIIIQQPSWLIGSSSPQAWPQSSNTTNYIGNYVGCFGRLDTPSISSVQGHQDRLWQMCGGGGGSNATCVVQLIQFLLQKHNLQLHVHSHDI